MQGSIDVITRLNYESVNGSRHESREQHLQDTAVAVELLSNVSYRDDAKLFGHFNYALTHHVLFSTLPQLIITPCLELH